MLLIALQMPKQHKLHGNICGPQDPADACAADDLQSKKCNAVPKCLKQHEKDQPCSCWAAQLQSQEPVSCNAQMPHAM